MDRKWWLDPIVWVALFRLRKQRLLHQRLLTLEKVMANLGLTEEDLEGVDPDIEP